MAVRIRKGDTVAVIAGKDRGKTGKVLKLITDRDRVVVEGINIAKRHRRAQTQGDVGGIVEFEAPIHISNVMPIDPKSGKPTRISIDRSSGQPIRVARRSGEKID